MKKSLIVFLLAFFITTISIASSPTTPNALAQTQQYASPSTVWREFPYIPPHLVQNSTHYVYVTDWGN